MTEPYRFSELPYVPTDFTAAAARLKEYTEKIRAARSVEEVLAIDAECDAMIDDGAGYAATLTYIRSSLDCTDEFYAEAAQTEAMGLELLDQTPYLQALLDSPFLPELEEKFGPEYCPRLERQVRLRSAGLELLAKEQAMINQYQQKKAMIKVPFRGETHSEAEMYALFDSPDRQTRIDARKATFEAFLAQKDDLAPMLLELIDLRCQIAKANGFDSYLDYANVSYFRRGYGEAELTAFCEQVKTDLMPLLAQLREEQRRELGVDKLMVYDLSVRFRDGNAVPIGGTAGLTEASQKMYDSLSPEFGKFFRAMIESESFSVDPSPNKIAGMGFCTVLRRGLLPFVFGNCNGTDTDVSVFTHEIGHAWQGYRTGQQNYPDIFRDMALDAVEIPSKTMELFAYPYAEGFFGADAEKFRQGHFREALREIAAYCSLHELNTWIYTHPGASFDEIAAAGAEIEKLYEPRLDYGELEPYILRGGALLRNLAVYGLPRYVISYALSEMCAMDLFARRAKDPAAAWDAYEKLCASGGSRSYPETLRQAGLSPAYAPGSVKKVADFAREYLKL